MVAVVLLVAVVGLALGVFVVGDLLAGDGLGGDEPGGLLSGDETPAVDAPDIGATEAHLHEAVNDERTAHDVAPVGYDADLAVVARNHSVHMAQAGFFGHDDPDGAGPGDRVEASSVECDAVGENLVQGYWDQPFTNYDDEVVHLDDEADLAAWFVDAWMDSPEHRENLLDDWDVQGLGIYHDASTDKVYATQKFCTETRPFPLHVTAAATA